ncbi:MAG: hypothetical protein DME24_01105 [Verrucomicrobia bacterium]|nr:MAG: hypothetical protein DME24_01105 [Verrucomicrobiota bacterium]
MTDTAISGAELAEAHSAATDILGPLSAEPLSEAEREQFIIALKAVLNFAGPKRFSGGQDHFRAMGRRLLALAWTVDPSLIEESPSLAQIAKAIGCTRATLSVHSAQARRQFGIRNRLSCHGWNYREAKTDS